MQSELFEAMLRELFYVDKKGQNADWRPWYVANKGQVLMGKQFNSEKQAEAFAAAQNAKFGVTSYRAVQTQDDQGKR
jgi:hypothetical protein